jgi:glycosyltransferase involved in cell wall biosynthesis
MALDISYDAVRLSVVMPVYNAARYLSASLDSVLAQSFSDFELLAHDDGSQDDSWAILTDYASRDLRVRISQGANQGLPRTLNHMIGRASGELIARFDADDLCLPDRFEKQLTRFDRNPDLVVSGGAAQIIDADGRPISVKFLPLTHEEIDGFNLRGQTSFQHPAIMMRRDAVLAAGGYHPDFHGAEDHDLWLRMAEIGRLENLPDVLIRYRIHDDSISSTKRDLQRQLCLRACEAAWQRRGITDGRFEYQEWRMGNDAQSRLAFNIDYAWQAWTNGYRGSWRHYALKALGLSPLSRDAWKVLVLGAIRRPAHTRKQDFD